MNDTETPTPTPKPTRKRKTTTPRAPRVIDPAVLAIRREASERVKEYHRQQASGGVLQNIITKQLPRLTETDIEKLRAAIARKPVNAPEPGN